MASTIYEWEAYGQRLRLCERDLDVPEHWIRLPTHSARWAVSSFAQDAAKLSALRAWLVRRSGGLYRPGTKDLHLLESELERGRLVVLSQPAPKTALGRGLGRRDQEERERPEPRPERAWVEFTVVDDSDPARPLKGVSYRITLPDRSVRTGVLDSAGRVREDDLAPGKCWAELTDVRRGLA